MRPTSGAAPAEGCVRMQGGAACMHRPSGGTDRCQRFSSGRAQCRRQQLGRLAVAPPSPVARPPVLAHRGGHGVRRRGWLVGRASRQLARCRRTRGGSFETRSSSGRREWAAYVRLPHGAAAFTSGSGVIPARRRGGGGAHCVDRGDNGGGQGFANGTSPRRVARPLIPLLGVAWAVQASELQ